MEITQLWRYPVKSMIGEPVASVELNDLGVAEYTLVIFYSDNGTASECSKHIVMYGKLE